MPQPGIEEIEPLSTSCARRASPSTPDRGKAATGAPGVDLSAYRIVQEALTNSLRHAGPAQPPSLSGTGRALEVEVVDDGSGPGPGPRAGYGLVGIRERISLLDGDLAVGPRREGGFACAPTCPWPSRREGPRAVADDQPLVRTGFRTILEAEGDIEVVAEAEDGRRGGPAAPRGAPRHPHGHPHAGARRPGGHAAPDPAARARPALLC